MPFFSVGYSEKERLEVELVGDPADPKPEGYDWIRAHFCCMVATWCRIDCVCSGACLDCPACFWRTLRERACRTSSSDTTKSGGLP